MIVAIDRVVVDSTSTPSMVPVCITLLQKNVMLGATRKIKVVDASTYVAPLELTAIPSLRLPLLLCTPIVWEVGCHYPTRYFSTGGTNIMTRNVCRAPNMPWYAMSTQSVTMWAPVPGWTLV